MKLKYMAYIATMNVISWSVVSISKSSISGFVMSDQLIQLNCFAGFGIDQGRGEKRGAMTGFAEVVR